MTGAQQGRGLSPCARGALALLLAALAAGSHAASDWEPPQKQPARVGMSGYDMFPYRYRNETTGEWQGMLVDLLAAVCDAAYLDCEVVEFGKLDQRIPLLASGGADFLLDILSVTEERAEQVDFVNPGWYSAGTVLYTTPETARRLEGAGGWAGLAGVPICVVSSTYATPQLVNQYKIEPVEVPTVSQGAEATVAGNCTALAFDSGFSATGGKYAKYGLVEVAGVAPILTTPYAIAVQKGNDVLRRRLSAALVEQMQSGADSPMLRWEQEHLADNGVLSNSELFDVVEAVSYFKSAHMEDGRG